MNGVVKKMVEDWPGEITIINGRAQHPQSQGLVEQGNAKVKDDGQSFLFARDVTT